MESHRRSYCRSCHFYSLYILESWLCLKSYWSHPGCSGRDSLVHWCRWSGSRKAKNKRPFVHSDPVLTWQITQSKDVASVRWTWLTGEWRRKNHYVILIASLLLHCWSQKKEFDGSLMYKMVINKIGGISIATFFIIFLWLFLDWLVFLLWSIHADNSVLLVSKQPEKINHITSCAAEYFSQKKNIHLAQMKKVSWIGYWFSQPYKLARQSGKIFYMEMSCYDFIYLLGRLLRVCWVSFMTLKVMKPFSHINCWNYFSVDEVWILSVVFIW